MQMLQTTVATRRTEFSSSPTEDAGGVETLAEVRRMADAGDDAIEKAYSGDAEAFLEANKQCGGQ